VHFFSFHEKNELTQIRQFIPLACLPIISSIQRFWLGVKFSTSIGSGSTSSFSLVSFSSFLSSVHIIQKSKTNWVKKTNEKKLENACVAHRIYMKLSERFKELQVFRNQYSTPKTTWKIVSPLLLNFWHFFQKNAEHPNGGLYSGNLKFFRKTFSRKRKNCNQSISGYPANYPPYFAEGEKLFLNFSLK
jgi:hypothetical protein